MNYSEIIGSEWTVARSKDAKSTCEGCGANSWRGVACTFCGRELKMPEPVMDYGVAYCTAMPSWGIGRYSRHAVARGFGG